MIGIIITTFERDELLFKSVQSVLDNWQHNFKLIIVDQGNMTDLKEQFIFIKNLLNKSKHYYKVPFNSGLSYCRNFGVQKAKELGCDYVLIGSDSFLFNESIKNINKNIEEIFNKYKFDLIGFELEGCKCGWEANLNLIKEESFELNFINKNIINDLWLLRSDIKMSLYKCDIVRNFFLATTESLLNIKWDENLKLCEHEDFFWRYKQNGYKVGWTNFILATKMTDRPNEYLKFRQQNFREGQRYLREKYGIKGWVTYKHLERAKK